MAEEPGPGYLRQVSWTAAFNLSTALLAAAAGVLLARTLGAEGRGDYAAVTALYGLVITFFELGLPASLVYFSARYAARTDSYVRTSLAILTPLAIAGGAFTVLAGFTFLRGSDDRQAGFLVAAACVVITFCGAPAVFTLLPLDIRRWNVVRLSQALAFGVLLAIALLFRTMTVPQAVSILALSLGLQAGLAWYLYKRMDVPKGEFSRSDIGPMFRYGMSNVASTAPNAVNGRVDQLVLALLVAPAALGQYAVAVSLSLMAAPLVWAFGNVALPRIARGDDFATTARQAIWGAFAVSALGMAVILVSAPVVIPLLFGPGFSDVPGFLVALAPGAIFVVVNQVLGDVLRGRGRPGLVAWSEWTGVLVTAAGLALLVPRFGATGAAITSSVAYVAVHMLLQLSLRHVRRSTVLPG